MIIISLSLCLSRSLSPFLFLTLYLYTSLCFSQSGCSALRNYIDSIKNSELGVGILVFTLIQHVGLTNRAIDPYMSDRLTQFWLLLHAKSAWLDSPNWTNWYMLKVRYGAILSYSNLSKVSFRGHAVLFGNL